VFFGERKMVDEEGFQYRYVPKETIVIEKSAGGSRKGSRKYSNVSAGSSSGKTAKEKFVYVKKQQPK
jgi:hypothetical protein